MVRKGKTASSRLARKLRTLLQNCCPDLSTVTPSADNLSMCE